MDAHSSAPPPARDARRRALRLALALEEEEAVRRLRALPGLSPEARARATVVAAGLVAGARARADERTPLDAFLQEFGLSNQEGVALLCLAEALLRVPDDATADRLIAEKLSAGDWGAHAGRSDSLFVNASTWALMLTGRLVELDAEIRGDALGWLRGLGRRVGEPVVRGALRRGMRIVGGEFVVGRTLREAFERGAREPGLALCTFDMLGEGARTLADADRHLEAYASAIDVLGGRDAGAPLAARSAISIKLSALEPRYALVHRETVLRRLAPKVAELARRAARVDVGLTVDAEEAERLEPLLDVVEALAGDPSTRGWEGLGFAVQAYDKRAPEVVAWAAETARDLGRRMTLRLVKGAYWDAEVKRAQQRGLDGYPVFTRKVTTDVAYLACAARLLGASDVLYPQFATHNAHTVAAVLELRPPGAPLEFQRLHGMGALLYDEARRRIPGFPPVRVYAPVGEHADLLAYLVRRLLENGANTSFVNRFLDEQVPLADVVGDPVAALEALPSARHPRIPAPPALFGEERRNSRGLDFGDPLALEALAADLGARRGAEAAAGPILGGEERPGDAVELRNPADRREVVGRARDATAEEIREALERGARAQRAWDEAGGAERAACLERASELLEARRPELVRLLVREAGKTLPDAVAEVREAVDFCRYYAVEARRRFGAPLALPGPTGERNELALRGRGVFACVSPWNFPLAIFTGQVAAALAAGNAVVAKPAEATPLVAALAVRLLHGAGVPAEALHLVPARGPAFGEVALAHPALAGVAFTGSTATAKRIQRALAAREGAILPLVAETGGLNAMVVDSTALPEQVVDDAVASAFGSAGQRCSALRILFLQEEIADRVLAMLAGAMAELRVGDPADPDTDVGPVISEAAAATLRDHVARMRLEARVLAEATLDARHAHGTFVAPTLVELRDPRQLDREVFGPVLHVARWRAERLPEVLAAIRATGYGLTLGVQTRIDATWREVVRGTAVGNVYVNRNTIGAVVGVQPFGGEGLSGTGPKAGGPHTLLRFAAERTLTVNTTAAGGNAALLGLEG